MSTNVPSSRKIPQFGKLEFEDCIQNFRILVLNNLNDIPRLKADLITSGKLSQSEKTFIRAFAWKIYLNILPTNEKASLKLWIDETMNQRKNVRKMIRSNTINKLKGDPLGGGSSNTEEKEANSGWDDFITQSETVKLIKSDIDKSMPNEKLFKEPYIRTLQTTILTNFVKNHKKIQYRQGMNEILALIIYALYPYYVKSPNAKYTPELIDKWIQNPVDNCKDIYCFFHDESEFEGDVYSMYENLMVKFGLAKFFEDDKEGKGTSYFHKRIKNIINKKLSVQDRAIYSHFQNQNLNYFSAFHRWLKCLFKLEFPESDACLIWDYLFAHEADKNSGMFIYIDYIFLGMLINIKYQLLSRDSNGMLQVLTNYPKISPITNLLNLADKIEANLTISPNEKLPAQVQTTEVAKEEPKEPEKKVEETVTTPPTTLPNTVPNPIPNPLGQINPLLFNPNLMMNPLNPNLANLQNLQNNMMLAMMMQQAANQGVQNMNTIQQEVTPANALNELRGLASKYKNVMSSEDSKRMEFLIDSLSKKI